MEENEIPEAQKYGPLRLAEWSASMHQACCFIDSPVGRLRLRQCDDAIAEVEWSNQGTEHKTALLGEACRQLIAYFDKKLSTFDLPLSPAGSDFQRRVYAAMLGIEPGRTKSYGDLATIVAGSAQAVGRACGSNPIPIIIPCHRVVAANGLGGYSGARGIETKIELLRLEGAYSLLL